MATNTKIKVGIRVYYRCGWPTAGEGGIIDGELVK